VASPKYTADDVDYWYVPLFRAAPAAALACVITFAGGFYTPEYGLFSFGGYALAIGLLGLFATIRDLGFGKSRAEFALQSIVSVIAGVVSIIVVDKTLAFLLVVLVLWGAITGALELYCGIRSRRMRAAARDWIFVGALTVALGILALVFPPDFVEHYNAPTDGGSRILNTSVMIVGAIGVYAVVVAVYLAIAAFSMRWGAAAARKTEAQTDKATS
jgi:uncharacterized membrane protein HdeD (DUF308 family)